MAREGVVLGTSGTRARPRLTLGLRRAPIRRPTPADVPRRARAAVDHADARIVDEPAVVPVRSADCGRTAVLAGEEREPFTGAAASPLGRAAALELSRRALLRRAGGHGDARVRRAGTSTREPARTPAELGVAVVDAAEPIADDSAFSLLLPTRRRYVTADTRRRPAALHHDLVVARAHVGRAAVESEPTAAVPRDAAHARTLVAERRARRARRPSSFGGAEPRDRAGVAETRDLAGRALGGDGRVETRIETGVARVDAGVRRGVEGGVVRDERRAAFRTAGEHDEEQRKQSASGPGPRHRSQRNSHAPVGREDAGSEPIRLHHSRPSRDAGTRSVESPTVAPRTRRPPTSPAIYEAIRTPPARANDRCYSRPR